MFSNVFKCVELSTSILKCPQISSNVLKWVQISFSSKILSFKKKRLKISQKIIAKFVFSGDRKKQNYNPSRLRSAVRPYCYKLNTPSRFENRQAPRRSNNQRRNTSRFLRAQDFEFLIYNKFQIWRCSSHESAL